MTATVKMFLAVALLAGGAVAASADQPGPDWITIEQVHQKLQEAGYRNISKIEADDGRWEGKGIKNGTRMKFYMDPRTGAFIGEKPDD